jgi:HD-like signal output (HDOD) protein
MLSNTSLIKCDGDPSFDLTKVEAGIRNGDASLTTRLLRNTNGTYFIRPYRKPKSFVKTAQQTKQFCKSDQ